MPSLDPTAATKTHWRSLAELADSPRFRAFAEAEFPAEADPKGVNRRRWLQLMGASMALAGVSGCLYPKDELRPFVRRPEGRVPGEPEHFSTAMDLGGSAVGLLVTSYDGRPIKIEGNPAHPQSLGGTDVLAQATLLQLYDPDRSRSPMARAARGQEMQSWDKVDEWFHAQSAKWKQSGGAGLRVLAEPSSSPTLAALRDRLLKNLPKAVWHEYDPLSADNVREGTRLAFGKPLRPVYDLTKADVIVCLDADLLMEHPAALQHARAFAQGRDASGPDRKMNRLYAVESRYSITGTMADHRLAVRSGQVAALVAALEREIIKPGITPGDGKNAKFVRAMAKDLAGRQGRALVVAGPSQPPEVHAAVHRINDKLGSVGQTVTYVVDLSPNRPTHRDSLKALVDEMKTGKVDTLVILGGNPVYDAPVDLAFGEALAKVPNSIHLSLYHDETSSQCAWHLPQAHFLEAWGDARSWDGTYSIVQPLIEPIWGSRSAIELLTMVLGESARTSKRSSPRAILRPPGRRRSTTACWLKVACPQRASSWCR
jgi:MoCo/4Fe-4S cofactor protein with predicted Tat translocation signal